jgi:IPT/TIG domain
MRYFNLLLLVALLLVTLLTVSCGTPASSGSHDPLVMTVLSPPSIMTLTPNSVPVNSVPFIMTINGSNFGTDAVVFWQGVPQSTFFVTSNQLMVKVTDTDLMFMGLVPIYVRTLGQNSNTVDFDVTAQ